VLVTGGNRGLGRAAAEKLARRGCAVTLTARDLAKGRAAAEEIAAAVPGAEVEALELDLASRASIRRFGEAFEARGGALSVLLNSAGVMQQSKTRRTTIDGFEETLGTNVLGPFLLTKLLLPSLRRAPSARVVNVSSSLHMPGSRGPEVRFDFDDPQLERAYDPDVVLPLMPFASSVEQATDTFAYACLDPALEGVRGKFIRESKITPSSPESNDAAKQRRFWALACEMLGEPDWP